MKRPKVDLRKRHPWHHELGKAIAVGWFGLLVDLAGVGELSYFHDYQYAFNMVVSTSITAGALRMLYLIRRVYPLSLYEAWILRLARKRTGATRGASST